VAAVARVAPGQQPAMRLALGDSNGSSRKLARANETGRNARSAGPRRDRQHHAQGGYPSPRAQAWYI